MSAPLTFDELHDDAQSVIASNLNLSGLKALRATSKANKAAADVQYHKLSNTLLTILFGTDTDTCLKTLCSHLKQALNRSLLMDPRDHQHVHLNSLHDKVLQACEAVDKQIGQAQQKREDIYKGGNWNTLDEVEALTDDFDMEILLLQQKSSHLHGQEADLRYFVIHPQSLNLEFIKTRIVEHLLRDRNNFARNVVTLYNAYVVGSNSIRETSTFKFVETGDASKTQVVIKPTGKDEQGFVDEIQPEESITLTNFIRYTFFEFDNKYTLSVQFVDDHEVVQEWQKLYPFNGIITIEIPMNAANARFVQTFIDSIKVLQTFSAVPGRSWYRTGPAFLSYIDTLLWSVNISKDDIKLKWFSCTDDDQLPPPVMHNTFRQTCKTAASDIVDRVLATGYPFTWNEKLNRVDFRASFVDLCHVTSVKPLGA
tara:strand:+ start:8012 stop:9289 length:1278 start_codon:yes stop_codon:yes gene_type:complete